MGAATDSGEGASAPLGFDKLQLQFLTTKVVPPVCRGLVDRPRLELASLLGAKRLGVIRGPAGFGKTSLATTWAGRLRERGDLVAWLTIEPDDNEPARFLFYMTQALHRAVPAVGSEALQLIGESLLIDPKAVVSTLINDISELDEDVYLFLEDYHVITSRRIDDAIAFFIRHAPSHAHLVLTTRTEPPFQLPSLRANNQLLEIDASALRFDLNEIRAFVQHQKGASLDPSQIALLHQKTEGWPAALRIVASAPDFGLGLRDISTLQSPMDEYISEVLNGLPEPLVAFMLRTAVLSRLSTPLCESVAKPEVSGWLELIEGMQLLVTVVDREGRWLRYHPLLADYLKQRLESEYHNEIPELNRRAADWYAAGEMWTDAVQHAIASADFDRAAEWIEKCAMDLVKRGDLLTLLTWQRSFPSQVMRRQLAVRLAIAWSLALAIRANDALEMLRDMEDDIAASEPAQRDQLVTECRLVRCVALSLRDEGREALPLAEECLSKTNDPWMANVAASTVRYWRLRSGDIEGFYATPSRIYSSEPDGRRVFEEVYRLCTNGIAEVRQIRFFLASRYYAEALQSAELNVGQNSIAAALPASLSARILYEQGKTEEAEALLVDRLPFINAGGNIECMLSAYAVMVRIAAFRRNYERAHILLEHAERLAATRAWPRFLAAIALDRAWLFCREGRISEAIAARDHLERLCKMYDPALDFGWADIQRFGALARAYVASAQKRFDLAISTLEQASADSDRVHDKYFALRTRVHLATVYFRAGQTNKALDEFRGVVESAANAGMYQTIMDEGPEIGSLLELVRSAGDRTTAMTIWKDYVAKLAAACETRYGIGAQPGERITSFEQLSEREGTILELIAAGLSNKEIARSLSIAPETVKSHIKRIFMKLNTEKRAHAVARAQSLGILPTHRGESFGSMRVAAI